MSSKCQKWCLTFMKFHRTLLAFKTLKSSISIANFASLNAKKQGVYNAQKEAFKRSFLAF